ncbi:MAG: DsrE family protein [Fretibacterium sp.]|nr:DsrE family protein [Fretibacterium sp.]
MIKLNAAGDSDSLAMIMQALEKGVKEIQVTAEDTTAALKIKQLLEDRGFNVQIQDDNGRLMLFGSQDESSSGSGGRRTAPSKTPSTPPGLAGPVVGPRRSQFSPYPARRPRPTFLILNRRLGGDSSAESKPAELGEILMKSFLNTLTKASTPPEAVILMNEGVKLALFNTSTCDHLKALEAQDVRILVSGTCAMHFGITDSIGTGVLANMQDIIAAINNAEKCVTL